MLKKGIYEHVINQITKQHIHEIEQQGMVCMRLSACNSACCLLITSVNNFEGSAI